MKLSNATLSKISSLLLFFIENYQVCHIHTKLFSLSLFQLTLSSTLLLPFFNSNGLATFPFKTVDFVTLIWSSLLLFYWKRSSSLLFVRNCRVCYSGIFRHTGILGLRMREFDAGLWTLDSGRWTLDSGLWTLDSGLWTLDSGCWTLESGGWTLDVGRWTLKTLEARLWTLGIGCWILDVKTLRSTVNPFQANVLFLFNHLKTSKARGFQRFSDDMESELQLEMN